MYFRRVRLWEGEARLREALERLPERGELHDRVAESLWGAGRAGAAQGAFTETIRFAATAEERRRFVQAAGEAVGDAAGKPNNAVSGANATGRPYGAAEDRRHRQCSPLNTVPSECSPLRAAVPAAGVRDHEWHPALSGCEELHPAGVRMAEWR